MAKKKFKVSPDGVPHKPTCDCFQCFPEESELETKTNKALELAEANAKAIQELEVKIQKTFLEYSHTLATLKDRNRLR